MRFDTQLFIGQNKIQDTDDGQKSNIKVTMQETRPLLDNRQRSSQEKVKVGSSSSSSRAASKVFFRVCIFAATVISLVHVLIARKTKYDNRLDGAENNRTNTIIRPGEVWYDTNNHPINAHGGGFLRHGGIYYWYGEIKEGDTYLPKANAEWGGTRVDLTGISCYSSTDLLNWIYRGNVLPAETDDPNHDLYRTKVAERPKVVYNTKTNKFVMWLHIDSVDYSSAKCGVAISDQPNGPFEYLYSFRLDAKSWPMEKNSRAEMTEEERKHSMPIVYRDYDYGQMARDLTVFIDDNHKGYLLTSSEDNPTMHISELTDDYLGTTGKYKRIFIGRYMEAPTLFKHNSKYYFIGSGCTAWMPNAARLAVSSESIWGPWIEQGNPCFGENANTTFFSQSTYVLPIGDNPDGINRQFIFIADRWNMNDLADSRYIWLPLSFDDDDNPQLHWVDEWTPEGGP